MKRAIVALSSLAVVTAGIAAAQDQGSTLITVQWDGGASASDAAAAPTPTPTPTPTPAPTPTPTPNAADAGPPSAGDGGAASGPAAPPGKTRYSGDMNSYYKYTGLDLDVSGGGGYFWGEKHIERGIGFARVRGGIMFASWPMFYSIGATFEANNLSPLNFGAEVEATHIGAGIWAALGGSVDWKGAPAGHLALGWSVLGVEGSVRSYKDALDVPMPSDYGVGFQIVGKVRIPIGFILYVLSRK